VVLHLPPGRYCHWKCQIDPHSLHVLQVLRTKNLVLGTWTDFRLQESDIIFGIAVFEGNPPSSQLITQFCPITDSRPECKISRYKTTWSNKEDKGCHIVEGRTGYPPAVSQKDALIFTESAGDKQAGKKVAKLPVH